MTESPDGEVSVWREALRHFRELSELSEAEQESSLQLLDVSDAVRVEIAQLIAGHRSGGVLDDGLQIAARTSDPPDAFAGQRVGPWRLIEEIGRGGMAVVYRAEREGADFQQVAAVKLLPRGSTGHDRFVREQQILAQLTHPNIARLLDGGIAEDGTPWIAMELIEGERLDVALRDASVEQVVERFHRVIDAVGHAHRNLVIHRDLKPSNVLVAADGQPKLLDFGIAALISDDGKEHATRILTPEYAAPEQVSGGRISTATDVFGLGAVLHKLLLGHPPNARGGKRTNADGGRELQRDLRNILDKALRPEAEQRYQTADAFADDLRRWREHEPVGATRGSRRYRLGKWFRRHRVGALAGAAVLLAVVGGAAAVAWQAEQTRRESTTVARQSRFLQEILASPGSVARGREARVLDVVKDAAEQIPASFPDASPARARLYATLGETFAQLQDFQAATSAWSSAVRDAEATSVSSRDQISFAMGLLHARKRSGEQTQIVEALQSLAAQAGEVLPAADELNALLAAEVFEEAADEDSPAAGDLYQVTNVLKREVQLSPLPRAKFECSRVNGLVTLGRFQDAIELGERAYGNAEGSLGRRNGASQCILHGLATALARAGRLEEALTRSAEAEDVAEEWLGPRDFSVFNWRMHRANILQELGRLDEAIELFESLIASRDTFAGVSEQVAVNPMQGLAISYLERGQYAAAEPLMREVVAAKSKVSGGEHPDTAMSRANLAELLLFAGRRAEALAEAEQAQSVLTTMLGADHPITLFATSIYAGALTANGRHAESVAEMQGVVEKMAAVFGDDDVNVMHARLWRAAAQVASGNGAGVIEDIERVHVWRLDAYGADHPRTIEARTLLDQVRR